MTILVKVVVKGNLIVGKNLTASQFINLLKFRKDLIY